MTVQIQDDFDLEKIDGSGQCFRWERDGNGFRIVHGEHALFIRPGGEDRYVLDCTEEEYAGIWRPYFDLDTSYAQIRGRVEPASDPYLAAAAEAGRGIRILRQDPWEIVITFIISQNRNIPMIRRSVEALCVCAGEVREDRAGRSFRTFPGPQQLSGLDRDTLMGPCVLGYRWKYVQDVSRRAAEGLFLPERISKMPDREAMEALMDLPGVGPKVASCILLFGFHRLDFFPVDVWIRRVLEEEYPQGYDREKYTPYNGVYQQYLFAYSRARAGRGSEMPRNPG
ncbi:MAG: hypothetical protein IJ088_12010 [Clostridia bacterium]|nr:hypothetical protein [Clostridia bacterium]